MLSFIHPNRPGSVSSYRKAADVTFLQLRDSVFCANCELISYNNSPRCLACGSQAVMSLARVLGGSIREETPRIVAAGAPELVAEAGDLVPVSSWVRQVAMPMVAAMQGVAAPINAADLLDLGVEHAASLTSATAAAIAISDGKRMRCRARWGDKAPDLNAEVAQEGATAIAVRTGKMWVCYDTERDAWINREVCRLLGIRSFMVAPMTVVHDVIGVLTVMSARPAAFTTQQAATVQFLAATLAFAAATNAEVLPHPVHPPEPLDS